MGSQSTRYEKSFVGGVRSYSSDSIYSKFKIWTNYGQIINLK